MARDVQAEIRKTVTENPIVVFIKGTKDFPQCGFSAAVVDVLNRVGAEYKDVNVLADPEIRQGIKEYGDWPTLPQVYIQGELVGGCDTTLKLHDEGKLQAMVDAALKR